MATDVCTIYVFVPYGILDLCNWDDNMQFALLKREVDRETLV